ncbi:MAG: hypothetical protein M1828_000237 [Chrysothrix sp. TS-e1954]|nr:MAG: hypothetical protein M1828_000237 [Chrysothrix sp. TS-e1954]
MPSSSRRSTRMPASSRQAPYARPQNGASGPTTSNPSARRRPAVRGVRSVAQNVETSSVATTTPERIIRVDREQTLSAPEAELQAFESERNFALDRYASHQGYPVSGIQGSSSQTAFVGNAKFDAIMYSYRKRTDDRLYTELYGMTWQETTRFTDLSGAGQHFAVLNGAADMLLCLMDLGTEVTIARTVYVEMSRACLEEPSQTNSERRQLAWENFWISYYARWVALTVNQAPGQNGQVIQASLGPYKGYSFAKALTLMNR